MSLQEYWHGDVNLLQAYQKAYLMNIHYVAYTQACMFQRAFECGYGNAWGKGAKHNLADMIDITEYFKKVMEHGKKKTAQPMTKEECDYENKRIMFEQSEWLKQRNGR